MREEKRIENANFMVQWLINYLSFDGSPERLQIGVEIGCSVDTRPHSKSAKCIQLGRGKIRGQLIQQQRQTKLESFRINLRLICTPKTYFCKFFSSSEAFP